MKTLYIPISSLNFNSIFASESISPCVFYQKRNFGYKTFEKIDELNSINNSIILFDKFPVFDIKPDGRDNYPMVVEIKVEFDIQPIKINKVVSIYQYAETIYLSPFTTKVYFLSEEAKKISIFSSERSLSTKMTSLYERSGCFEVFNDEMKIPKFQFTPDFNEGIEDVSDKDIAKYIDIDKRKNKAKGFLYSYLLGANKSLNKELIIIKKSTREIINIVSAIINSPDKIPTRFQKDGLHMNAEIFDAAYKKVDEEISELDSQLKKYGNEISVSSIKKILENRNLIEKIKNLFDIFEITTSSLSFESTISKINDKVIQIEKKYLANRQKINLSEKISFANIRLTRFDQSKPDFYMALINEYLSVDYQDESKLNIATIGIKLLIKMYEEKNVTWNPSIQRDYFNELLSNMQGKGIFDVNKNKDVIHQSFALFVLHKDKDEIEKLEAALISNTICEFRFAFGLWGAFNGFSNMPKTLTNDLFLSDDLDYISEVYKYIFKQIHGIEIEGNLKREIKTFFSKKDDDIKREEKRDATIIQQENEIEIEYREKLKQIQKISSTQIDKVIEVLKSNNFLVNKSLDLISKNPGFGKKSNLFKAIKGCLLPDQQKSIQQYVPTLGFDFPPEKDFYLDDNAWIYIEHLPFKNQKIKDKVKKNLKKIQDGYRPEGYYFKRGDSNENKEVINHFLVWSISEKNNYNKLHENDFPNEIREEIRKIFENKYPN